MRMFLRKIFGLLCRAIVRFSTVFSLFE
jgi:hypothetical protein